MLIEHATYGDAATASKVLDNDNVFRYCEFSGYSIEGGHIDGAFVGCKFHGLEWYWGLFNCCVFVDCKFTQSVFRGTSFSDCRFVDCEFLECQFLEDNLSRSCSAEGARVYGGKAERCKGAEFLFSSVAV